MAENRQKAETAVETVVVATVIIYQTSVAVFAPPPVELPRPDEGEKKSPKNSLRATASLAGNQGKKK